MNEIHPLRYCFSSLGCPHLGIEAILSIAEQWGFEGVELRAINGHTDIVRALIEHYKTSSAMAKAIQHFPVEIASLDSSLQLTNPTEPHMTEVQALAQWADTLEVPFIRVFDGKATGGFSDEESISTMLRTLDWWHSIKASHRFHCDLMIETHWLLTDPDSCTALAKASPHTVNILWDSFHTWRASPLSIAEVWKQLQPYVRHVHFRDGKRQAESLPNNGYSLPSQGDFPLPELFATLQKDRFRGWVSLEWERMWNPQLAPLDAALAEGRRLNWW